MTRALRAIPAAAAAVAVIAVAGCGVSDADHPAPGPHGTTDCDPQIDQALRA